MVVDISLVLKFHLMKLTQVKLRKVEKSEIYLGLHSSGRVSKIFQSVHSEMVELRFL